MATTQPKVTTWIEQFKAALADVLMRNGTIVEARSIYGAPYHRESTLHHRPVFRAREMAADKTSRYQHSVPAASVPAWCGAWAEVADLHEEVRSEFTDTDHDNATLNLVVATVTCRCGYITAERMEYRATVGDLLREVLSSTSVPRVLVWDDYHRDDRQR